MQPILIAAARRLVAPKHEQVRGESKRPRDPADAREGVRVGARRCNRASDHQRKLGECRESRRAPVEPGVQPAESDARAGEEQQRRLNAIGIPDVVVDLVQTAADPPEDPPREERMRRDLLAAA